MTARARRRRRKECTGKVAHPTEDVARMVAGRMTRKRVFVGWYHCPWCRLWHTGHQPT